MKINTYVLVSFLAGCLITTQAGWSAPQGEKGVLTTWFDAAWQAVKSVVFTAQNAFWSVYDWGRSILFGRPKPPAPGAVQSSSQQPLQNAGGLASAQPSSNQQQTFSIDHSRGVAVQGEQPAMHVAPLVVLGVEGALAQNEHEQKEKKEQERGSQQLQEPAGDLIVPAFSGEVNSDQLHRMPIIISPAENSQIELARVAPQPIMASGNDRVGEDRERKEREEKEQLAPVVKETDIPGLDEVWAHFESDIRAGYGYLAKIYRKDQAMFAPNITAEELNQQFFQVAAALYFEACIQGKVVFDEGTMRISDPSNLLYDWLTYKARHTQASGAIANVGAVMTGSPIASTGYYRISSHNFGKETLKLPQFGVDFKNALPQGKHTMLIGKIGEEHFFLKLENHSAADFAHGFEWIKNTTLRAFGLAKDKAETYRKERVDPAITKRAAEVLKKCGKSNSDIATLFKDYDVEYAGLRSIIELLQGFAITCPGVELDVQKWKDKFPDWKVRKGNEIFIAVTSLVARALLLAGPQKIASLTDIINISTEKAEKYLQKRWMIPDNIVELIGKIDKKWKNIPGIVFFLATNDENLEKSYQYIDEQVRNLLKAETVELDKVLELDHMIASLAINGNYFWSYEIEKWLTEDDIQALERDWCWVEIESSDTKSSAQEQFDESATEQLDDNDIESWDRLWQANKAGSSSSSSSSEQ